MDTLVASESTFNTWPPELLYHYTNEAALAGILESKVIRASKVQSSSQREIIRALELASRNLAELKRYNPSRAAQDELEGLALEMEGYESVNICAASFTECGDSVSHFERYGRYAIGFRSERLAWSNSSGFYFAQCVYDEKRQTELVRYALRIGLRDLPAGVIVDDIWPPASLGNLGNMIPPAFPDALVTLAPLVKDPRDKRDAEWRLVSPYPRLLEDSAGSKPYVRLAIPDEGVARIIVGRGPEERHALDCATALARKHVIGLSVRLSNTSAIGASSTPGPEKS